MLDSDNRGAKKLMNHRDINTNIFTIWIENYSRYRFLLKNFSSQIEEFYPKTVIHFCHPGFQLLSYQIIKQLDLLLNSGNIVLDSLSPKRLRQRYICGDHFDTNMYMNPKAKVLTLVPNAVSRKYQNVSSESNLLYNIR